MQNGKGSRDRVNLEKYAERFPFPCRHRFVDGICIKCGDGIACEACGRKDSMIFHQDLGRFVCHHTHRRD